jgi:transketolase
MSKMDPRKAFEESLLELGRENKNIVAVSCDSASGGGMKSFFEAFPERSVETGISEQNAVGICAALAKQGMIPIIVVITPFITMRAYEQVRDDVGYMNMNVKLVGSGGGLAYSTLGSTHQAVEDVALMQTIPNMTILSPCDAYDIKEALRMAVGINGPVYIRMPRQAREVKADQRSLLPGKAEILKDGKDVAIFATGPMVEEAQKAAEILKQDGIDAAMLGFMTVKPLDQETVKGYAKKVKMIVTVEEHSVVGGFGCAVATCLAPVANTPPIHILGVREKAKNTGPYVELLEHYGLTGEKIAEKIKNLQRIEEE